MRPYAAAGPSSAAPAAPKAALSWHTLRRRRRDCTAPPWRCHDPFGLLCHPPACASAPSIEQPHAASLAGLPPTQSARPRASLAPPTTNPSPTPPPPVLLRYICLGYSAWDEEALKRAAAARRSQADAVQLPYCEGLEVVSSAAVHHRPELMGAGAPGLGAAAAGEPVAAPPEPPGGADVRQRPGRSFVPGRLPEVPDGVDWSRFKER